MYPQVLQNLIYCTVIRDGQQGYLANVHDSGSEAGAEGAETGGGGGGGGGGGPGGGGAGGGIAIAYARRPLR